MLNYFSQIFFWWVIYSSPVTFIYKRFNFCYSLRIFFDLFQSEESIYNTPCLKFILWHLWYSKWIQSKIKSLPLTDVSNPPWYLFRSDWKSVFITSPFLSLIMTSMLLFSECIIRFLSLALEEIKLIPIVNWIFNVSDFLRLLWMHFKRGLTLLRYSSADSLLFLSSLLSDSI